MKRHYVVEVFLDVDNEDQLNDAYSLLAHTLKQLKESNKLPLTWDYPTFLTMIEIDQDEEVETVISNKKELKTHFPNVINGEVWDKISEGARYAWLEGAGYIPAQCTMFASKKFAELSEPVQQIVLTT
jgi:hypothetical protein